MLRINFLWDAGELLPARLDSIVVADGLIAWLKEDLYVQQLQKEWIYGCYIMTVKQNEACHAQGGAWFI